MGGNLFEGVFLLAMLGAFYCNDTINRCDDILNHGLVVVKVVMVGFYFPAKDDKTLLER